MASVCVAETPPADNGVPQSLEELRQRLTEHVANPKFASAFWGVKIVSLDTGNTIFETNAHKLFTPASNTKLFTVALALSRLGVDYRIHTSLYGSGRPDPKGTLDGNLILYGRGDPTINARLHEASIDKSLAPLILGLAKAGVTNVTGDLVADESYFRGPPLGAGWSWDDPDFDYGALVSALTINDNLQPVVVLPASRAGDPCLIHLPSSADGLVVSNRTFTGDQKARRTIEFNRSLFNNILYVTGQLPLADSGYTNNVTFREPAKVFASILKEALGRNGIQVAGGVRQVNWQDRPAKLSQHERRIELSGMDSLPLGDIAREILKPSQNLYADLLLAHVGEKSRGASSPGVTSEERGIEELNRFLAEAGLEKREVLFEEGSGLSRDNLTTPAAVVALLHYMHRSPAREAFVEALPVAATDGTLRGRMRGTPAAGKVRAKTGSLRWAQSLSGYVTTAGGEHLAFAILLNRYHNVDPSRPARLEIDFIPELLASFKGRTPSQE